MIHSFDVFETTLLRDVLVPSDLFLDLGEQLKRDGNGWSAEDFQAARIEAESRARRDSPHEEVTLAEIWEELLPMLGFDAGYSGMDAEMNLEAKSLSPVEETARRIQSARSAGIRVIFISDTYFPEAFLLAQLTRHGCYQPGDGLYLSSSHRKTKARGSLFQEVLKLERIAPAQLLHYGDNGYADIEPAERLGIRAQRCAAPDLSVTERAIFQSAMGTGYPVRKFVAASRSFRILNNRGAHHSGEQEYAGTFLGPLAVAFASWVIARARAAGVDRLYFCARDCFVVQQAAKQLVGKEDGPECHYLEVSRQALLLASTERVSRHEMGWLTRCLQTPLLSALLGRLHLTPDECEGAFDKIGEVTLDGDRLMATNTDWEKFWEIMESSPVRDIILKKASGQRAAALAYFGQIGLTLEGKVGIVDLGWALSCQRALRTLLTAANTGFDLKGYYLGLNQSRYAPAEAGQAEALFYGPASDLTRFGQVFHPAQYTAILEQMIALPDAGSTCGYHFDESGKSRPVHNKNTLDADDMEKVRRTHHHVADFVKNHGAILESSLRGNDDIRAVIQSIIQGVFHAPSRGILDAISHLKAGLDQNDLDVVPLFTSWRFKDVILNQVPLRFRPAGYRIPHGIWAAADRIVSEPRVMILDRTLKIVSRVIRRLTK